MYEEVLTELSRSGARYLIIGGIALGLSGYPRATLDLDILPDLTEENLDKIIKTLQRLGYKPRLPVNAEELKDPKNRERWYKEKHMRVFSFFNADNPLNEIDLMIYHPLSFEDCFKRKQSIKIRDIDVYVASIDDLLKLKRGVMRNKDKEDIRVLEEIKKLKDAK